MLIANGNKYRLHGLDIMKGIAIFLVVLYHVGQIGTAGTSGFVWYFNLFIDSVISVAMAIFFFVSGFLLMNKSEIDLKTHYIKLLKNLLVLWFWSMLYILIFSIYRHEYMSFKEAVSAVFILKNGWNHHLWFFYAYLGMSAFYPVILRMYRTHKSLYVAVTVITSIIGYGLWITYEISLTALATGHVGGGNVLNGMTSFYRTFTIRALYIVSSFFIGGACNVLKDTGICKTRRIGITALALATFVAMTACNGIIVKAYPYSDIIANNFSSPIALLVTLALFVNLIGVKPSKVASFAGIFGKYSFGIYLLHWFFVMLLGDIVGGMNLTRNLSSVFAIAVALTVCVSSAVIACTLYNNDYSRALFLK